MTDIFASAASGMKAQQARIDAIANNLANMVTIGYRTQRVDLASLPQQPAQVARAGDGTQPPTELGEGVAIAGVTRSFNTGALQITGSTLDLAIIGRDAFFQVTIPGGRTAFTRDGAFRVDGAGQIVTASGDRLAPPITLPPGAQLTAIAPDGTIMGTVPGADTPQVLGSITLARFPNPDGLELAGANRYSATVASGQAEIGTPGTSGLPEIRSGMLESSNVDLAEQATMLIEAQRAYTLNVRSAQTLDEMIGVLLQTRQ